MSGCGGGRARPLRPAAGRGRRRLGALAACLALAGLPACGLGGDQERLPQGAPTARVPAADISVLARAEDIRALLTSANALARLGRQPDARLHLRAARRSYRGLSDRVRAQDARLDQEIAAAFEEADRLLAAGARHRRVERPIGALAGRLVQGAVSALVPRRAQEDPGAQAMVLAGLLRRLPETYARTATGDPRAELAFQLAFGQMVRARTVGLSLADALGPDGKRLVEDLAAARRRAFPRGVVRPARPPVAVLRAAAERARRRLAERFELRAR